MRIAVTAALTDETITPVRLAKELEERGFDGLWVPEHTHIPVERATPFPYADENGEVARWYGRLIDPFVALAQASAVTSRLHLGIGVLLLAQHDPIVVAKQAASLDHVTGGRFSLGVGFGWNKEEAADHGVEWSSRRDLVLDRMRLMRALWADEPTEYKGVYGSVRASVAYPKPVRGGSPRTMLGGAAGPKLFSHIVEYGDGWLPLKGADLRETLPVLRTAWEEAGRDPEALQVVPYAVDPTPERMAVFAELGIEEVVLLMPADEESGMLRALDDFARYLH
ncbi:TIGR03619 family F420-dependent LLM class oxidoreductase [Streptomyces qinzhouensis]|uniref:TIGR03619 family F420-dependent LLM class oxidoreductase n=1 Tax=Streptomyces qinzhouensis TaxID=2599401 RepID=A0A5B8JA49_9ACTN|nr:TIGR03619 family F420-dependent LLM class oxidoreductase [Streptomyces qinzhouensis]QDY77304.1 TIGR03619 family F420-dependent LLM class oxidoreductase [Streptomyces qinzhouensis]